MELEKKKKRLIYSQKQRIWTKNRIFDGSDEWEIRKEKNSKQEESDEDKRSGNGNSNFNGDEVRKSAGRTENVNNADRYHS